MQEEHQYLPNTDRLSVLTASILLAYALLAFISIPERNLALRLAGAVFTFRINFATLIAIISAGLAASGTDWLLRGHPRLGRSSTFQHWLIPALTAWVIGVPLNSLEVGLQWWAVLAFGGALLVMVLVSEYIAVDPGDTRHGPAAVGLTAVSYAMFLILTIALAAARTRVYVMAPALGAALFLVTLRGLYLRLDGHWYIAWSVGITLVVVEVAVGLHYWPLSPLRFGLFVLGLAYALSSAAGSIEEGRPWRSVWIEPAVMLVALWGLAIGLR